MASTSYVSRSDGLSVVSVAIAVFAAIFALAAVGIAVRETDGETAGSGRADTAPAAISVSLTDFSLDPSEARVAVDGTIGLSNQGGVVHNLAVEGTDAASAMIDAGGTGSLSLAGVAPGTYALFCAVPGHREAGMEGKLTVAAAADGETARAPSDGRRPSSAAGMDEMMRKVTESFPAKTKGIGGQILQPTIDPDGAKRFDLTARVVDWEVEPGRTVKSWTYNGTAPGPTIKVDPGDRLRVVLRNELPESTAIHFHGLRTPNAMDGVPDITQAPITPGTSFTYEFVAKGPAVGMYHSHHNAAEQVPNGLAATILVGDLPLPAGVSVARTYPMMLNDAGAIGFSLNGKSFPATEPVAVATGQWVLVHYLNEGVQAHPMHLHGLEQLVIAKDGFPLPAPYKADTVNVAPGERYSVLVHADEPGVWAWHCHILSHAERTTGMFGMVTAMIVK